MLTSEGEPRALVNTGQEIVPVQPAAPDIARLKKMFTDSRAHSATARHEATTDQDYYDGRQWTPEELNALRQRGQPQIVINRIKPAVNGTLGVIEKGSSDPRAYARNDEDEDAAEIATDSLRYAAETCRWQRTKLKAAKDYLITGWAACVVEVDERMDIQVTRIRWQEFFADPHSQEDDFKDARYLGVAKWMYVDAVKALYPDAEIDVSATGSARELTITDASDQDRPTTTWGDSKHNRVLVVDLYHDEGGWKRCVYYGGGTLAYGPSPFIDERGQPCCPIEAQSPYVDKDNQRYGIVRDMRGPQDEINMRRSKLLHLVNARQVRMIERDADMEMAEVRKEAARPDGVLPYGVEPVQTSDMASGQSQLLQESKNEIERMGPNPAVLGRENADASGRAHLIRQQAGMVELTPALGGLENWELRVYRQMWARIRQFWTDKKTIRVTDDIGAPKFRKVNEPEVTGHNLVMGPDGQPMIQPAMGAKNRPSEIDVDIIIDSTPNSATIHAEQFKDLADLARLYPQDVTFDDMLEASSMPNKSKLIEKRKARQEQQAQSQGPNPLQKEAMLLDMDEKKAGTELKRASAILSLSKAAGFHDPNGSPSQGAINPANAMMQLQQLDGASQAPQPEPSPQPPPQFPPQSALPPPQPIQPPAQPGF